MGERKGSAVWNGGIMDGEGKIALGSGLFEGAYSFGTRMGDEQGTNPEELLAASLAGCYAMALNAALERAGSPPSQVSAIANVHLGKDENGFVIKGIDLVADVSGVELDDAAFQKIAEDVKLACPIGRALGGTKINLTAKLVS